MKFLLLMLEGNEGLSQAETDLKNSNCSSFEFACRNTHTYSQLPQSGHIMASLKQLPQAVDLGQPQGWQRRKENGLTHGAHNPMRITPVEVSLKCTEKREGYASLGEEIIKGGHN